jgi:hypothetical protein
MTGLDASSATVFRVHWLPGTDTLLGTCHCGAEHVARDPVELWAWLLSHPEGHRPPAGRPRHPDGAPLTTAS